MSSNLDRDKDIDHVGLTSPYIVQHGTIIPGRHRYLCYFLHRYLAFRLPEVQALAEIANNGSPIDAEDGLPILVWENSYGNIDASPFWYIHVRSEDIVRFIAQRSMLLKAIIEVWGEGETADEMRQSVASFDPETKAKYTHEDISFKITVDTPGLTIPQTEKIKLIESMEDSTQFEGKFNLENPQHDFWLILSLNQAFMLEVSSDRERYYFGRVFLVPSSRSKLATYDLRKRLYIGPTSMDAELSFLMCNIAGIRKSSLVIDPFVGTGSVLVSAADLGGITLGCDIDIRVIKNGKKDIKGNPVNIWSNFGFYNLPYPLGIFRLDLHRSPFRENLTEFVDAIVSDPPYGVRAGGRKSKAKPLLHIIDRNTHVISTAPYLLGECLRDLVEFAARLLVVNGKLVYWLPAAEGLYFENELPQHPVMEILSNSEQALAGRYNRRMISMRKRKAYDKKETMEYYARIGPPVMSIDTMHEYVYATAEDGVSVSDAPKQRSRSKYV